MANPSLKNGYLSIAHELVEQFAKFPILGEEMRLIWVVLRHTWGWQDGNRKKDWDIISFSQFEKETGIKRSNACQTMKSLLFRKIILRSEKGYQLNQNYEEWVLSHRNTVIPQEHTSVIPQEHTSVIPQEHNNIKIKKRLNKTPTSRSGSLRSKGIALTNDDMFGNPLIQEAVLVFKAQLGGGSLDGSQVENRRFANLLINRLKKDYPEANPIDLIRDAIRAAQTDPFFAKNCTSFKWLYYNLQKVIQHVKTQTISPKSRGAKAYDDSPSNA